MNPLTRRYLSHKFVPILIVVIILVVNGITLMRFPFPHGDEAWVASRAWEFIQSGIPIGQLDKGVLDHIEGYRYFYSWISTLIQSIGIYLFGKPSLLAIRFVSLAIGIILLIAIYSIGSALDGTKLGILCVAFSAFSWSFLYSAHFGRPDIIAATFGYVGIAIQLNNRNANIWLSILTGLLTALAIEVHAYAAIFIPSIVALFIWKYKFRFIRKPDFWAFVGGVILGTFVYLGLHIFPNPQAFLRINEIVFLASRMPPLFTFNYKIIFNAFKEMVIMVFMVYPQVLFVIWAIYRMLKKRPPYMGTLLVLTGALLLSFTLLVRNKFLLYYAILYSPALSILLASLFNDFLKDPVNSLEKQIRRLIVIGICVVQFLFVVRFNAIPTYQWIISEVVENVEPGDVILASQLYWFGLSEHNYYSWENIAYYRRYKPGSRLEDLLKLLKPDLFIIDGQMENFIMDEDVGNKYFSEFKIPKSELNDFLNKNASLIKDIRINNDNKVRIYRINWDQIPED